METPIFPTTIANKVHKESAIQIATFLGGPLVAGYLIAENFKQLGEPEKVKKTWLWSILGFIAIMVLAFMVPQSVPAVVFTVTYTGVAAFIVKKYQSSQIKAHLEAGGGLYSTKRAVFTGIIGAIVLIAVVLAYYFILDALHII